jgi:hypothetical protein
MVTKGAKATFLEAELAELCSSVVLRFRLALESACVELSDVGLDDDVEFDDVEF